MIHAHIVCDPIKKIDAKLNGNFYVIYAHWAIGRRLPALQDLSKPYKT